MRECVVVFAKDVDLDVVEDEIYYVLVREESFTLSSIHRSW